MNKLILLLTFSILLLVPTGLNYVVAIDENNVIFDGGLSNFNSIASLNGPASSRFAVDFEIEQDTILRDVHIDVSQSEDVLAEFEYIVFEDNSGTPGAIIQAGQAVNEHKVPIVGTSLPPGAENFRYWFDLDIPLALEGQTTYWIQLQVPNGPGPQPATIWWWSADQTFGNTCRVTTDGGNSWVRCAPGVDNNIVLTGHDTVVGGEIIPIESTSLLLANAQSFTWMIPVTLSILGIGLFVVSRKSEN